MTVAIGTPLICDRCECPARPWRHRDEWPGNGRSCDCPGGPIDPVPASDEGRAILERGARALNTGHVAEEVAAVRSVVEREPITSASVSGVYETDSRSDGKWWRVCVSVNGRHVFQPRFAQPQDAAAFREAVGDALDRAT